MKKLNKAILEKQIKRFFKEQDAFPIEFLPVGHKRGMESFTEKAKRIIKENNKLFVILGDKYVSDEKIELEKFNTRSLMAMNAYLKAATTKLPEFDQWLLLHKTQFPDEPIKSWINENNYMNQYKQDEASLFELISHLLQGNNQIEGELNKKYIQLKMKIWIENVGVLYIVTPRFLKNDFYSAVLNLVIQHQYIKNGAKSNIT